MQFEFAGMLDVPDGRYLARDRDRNDRQTVLVVEVLGAPPPPARRRRRPRETEPRSDRPTVPLTRATAVRAFEPFDSMEDAAGWLSRSAESEDTVDALVAEGADLINRALGAHAAISENPHPQHISPERAVLVRIGYGSGEDVAGGRFSVAHDIDVRGGTSRRRRREGELRPQERLAAVLGGREQIDACETLLLRARADLDAGRTRGAALQLRVGLDALLIELAGALTDPAHDADLAVLETRHGEALAAAEAALHGDLDEEREQSVRELTEICQRVLRRRRVLHG